MSFRIKDGFTVGTTDIVNSSGQILPYQKDTTTIGQNLSKISDITAISFIRLNEDETVSALDAATFRTAIGAGTGSGTVTSVAGAGTVSGLTLTGTVTSSGDLTLGGTLSVTASNFASQTANTVLIAPNGSAGTPTFRALVAADIPALSYLSTSGGTLTGGLTVGGDLVVNGTLTSVNSNTLTVNDKNLELASVDAVTGLQATLTTGTNSVTLTAGVTNTLVAGQKLTKNTGTGVFGTGSGLTLNTTVTTGALATATVNAGGALYSVGDIINVSGGTGGQVTVTSTNGATGVVTGVAITTAGTGYSVATGAATTVATAAGPWILSISSSTAFTTNVNHSTAGAITFSSGTPTNVTADGGGITLMGTTSKTIVWDNANTNWTSSEHWNLPTGKVYKINNTTVLSSTQVLGRTPAGTTAGDIATIDATQTLTNKTLTSPTITGGTHTALTSLGIRDTSAAFDVTLAATSSTALTAGRTVTLDVVNSARTIKLAGNIDLANNLITSGNFALTLTTTAATNVTLPTTGTLSTLAGTETLTNKTFTDNTTTFQDNTDNTKKMQFELSGITTATTRTLTVPNVTDTLAVIGTAQTFTAAQTFRAANSIRAEAAATQDAVVLAGRAGGTSSYAVSLIPGTLSANRTLTLPNVTGIVHSSGDEILRIGGDVSTSEVTRSRGIEALYDGRSATARRLVGAGTTTATLTLSQSISNCGIGDLITVSGATSGEGAKTNGTWRVSSVTGEILTVSYATNGSNPSTITGTITGGDPNHQTGDQITILGATPSGLNGTWTITRTGASTFTFTATTQIASITVNGTTRVPTVKFVVGSTITAASYIAATDLGSVNISKVSALFLDQTGTFNFLKYSVNSSGVISADSARSSLGNITANQGLFSLVTATPVSGSGGTASNTTFTVSGQAVTDSDTEAVAGDLIINGGAAVCAPGGATTGGTVYIRGGTATGGTVNQKGNISIGDQNTALLTIGSSNTALNINSSIDGSLLFGPNNNTISTITTKNYGVTSNSVQAADSWSATSYRSASYIVQVSQGSPADEWYSSKIGILHNGTTTTMTEYEVLETGNIPITFTSAKNGTNIELKVEITDGATRNADIRLHRTLIAV